MGGGRGTRLPPRIGGATDRVALHEDLSAGPNEQVEVVEVLNALGDENGADLTDEGGHGTDERLTGPVLGEPAHETRVELDEVGLQLSDVAKRGIPGARVVDRDTESPGRDTAPARPGGRRSRRPGRAR